MARYYVREWDQRYEVDDKGYAYRDGRPKRAGPLDYIRLKVYGRAQGIGWRKLIAVAGVREAPMIFGIFCKFLEIAGDRDRDSRGYVEDTPDEPLSFTMGLHEKDVQTALNILCDPRLAWLQKEESSKEETTNTTQPTNQHSGKVPGVSGNSKEFLGEVDCSSKKPASRKFTKPTPAEVTAYANTIGFVLNGQEFCDYYESKGWLVGKTPMKSWQAAVRTWKNRRSEETPTTNHRCIHCGQPADGTSKDDTGQTYGWCRKCQPKLYARRTG